MKDWCFFRTILTATTLEKSFLMPRSTPTNSGVPVFALVRERHDRTELLVEAAIPQFWRNEDFGPCCPAIFVEPLILGGPKALPLLDVVVWRLPWHAWLMIPVTENLSFPIKS